MDILAVIASIFLIISCLYFILAPFAQKTEVPMTNEGTSINDEIRKVELYATLNEIEMDYKMNKLSDEDYHAMKRNYEIMVTEILQKEKNC